VVPVELQNEPHSRAKTSTTILNELDNELITSVLLRFLLPQPRGQPLEVVRVELEPRQRRHTLDVLRDAPAIRRT